MYFSCNVSFASLPVFLPTILNEMGFTSVNAQGLTAPPFFLSFLLTLLTTWIADRTQQRGFMILALTIIGGIGYVILATTKAVGPRYLGCFLAAAGIFPASEFTYLLSFGTACGLTIYSCKHIALGSE
jgi:cyanate permease